MTAVERLEIEIRDMEQLITAKRALMVAASVPEDVPVRVERARPVPIWVEERAAEIVAPTRPPNPPKSHWTRREAINCSPCEKCGGAHEVQHQGNPPAFLPCPARECPMCRGAGMAFTENPATGQWAKAPCPCTTLVPWVLKVGEPAKVKCPRCNGKGFEALVCGTCQDTGETLFHASGDDVAEMVKKYSADHKQEAFADAERQRWQKKTAEFVTEIRRAAEPAMAKNATKSTGRDPPGELVDCLKHIRSNVREVREELWSHAFTDEAAARAAALAVTSLDDATLEIDQAIMEIDQ